MTAKRTSLNLGAEKQGGSGLSFAPLVDIVLLLICFYLFVTKSLQSYEDELVTLPEMAHDQMVDRQPSDLVINLREDDSISVNSQPTTLDDLTALIGQQITQGAASGHSVRVVVRADRRQSYGKLDEILAACREIGVTQVLLRATEK